MVHYREWMDWIGIAVDIFGVFIIVVGTMLATGYLVWCYRRGQTNGFYRLYRRNLGRAILLGLEFLIAADIIRTVVVAPTLEHVVVLGLIVLIRSFLSIALQLELEGRWPWQRDTD